MVPTNDKCVREPWNTIKLSSCLGYIKAEVYLGFHGLTCYTIRWMFPVRPQMECALGTVAALRRFEITQPSPFGHLTSERKYT